LYGGSVILISEFHKILTRINKKAKTTTKKKKTKRQKDALGNFLAVGLLWRKRAVVRVMRLALGNRAYLSKGRA
jgi:hypothetical protein